MRVYVCIDSACALLPYQTPPPPALPAVHPWARVNGEAPDQPLDPAVLTKLKHFSAMNKLKKLALKVGVYLPA